jgi:hypothetical protein
MSTVPFVLMVMGGAFMFVGAVCGILTFLQIAKTFAKNEGIPIDGCREKVFPKFYRYAVCIAVFGCGSLSAVIGLVWYLVARFA